MNTQNFQTQIDKSWTLFLDRDGVINEEIVGSYVTSWSEFHFCEGALEALKELNNVFGRIVIVTNQRGVGRGIMTMESLKEIHSNMRHSIEATDGRIDAVYACTAEPNDDHNRKPNTGMGMQAKEDFQEIDFKRSVIIGNSLSDMEFGKRLAMHTIFLTTKHEPFDLPNDLIDDQFPSLISWAQSLAEAEVMS